MEKKFRYLVPGDYMADPAVHVFDGKLYIYPSHDRESGVEENDNGDHFDMCDYHVFSTEDVMNGTVTDHGVVLKVSDVPWAGRQLWDCDVACKNGNYYMYFPLKDRHADTEDVVLVFQGEVHIVFSVFLGYVAVPELASRPGDVFGGEHEAVVGDFSVHRVVGGEDVIVFHVEVVAVVIFGDAAFPVV